MKSILKYPGSKWRIAQWIISHFPKRPSVLRRGTSWNELPERILMAAERLKQVQIECMPALDLIKKFNFPNVLIYCDPPYLVHTRTAHVKQQYSNEMLSEKEHAELLEVLLQHKGYVIISGYESELYKEMLEDNGWCKAIINSNDQSNKPRQEVIWMNYVPSGKQLSLFAL